MEDINIPYPNPALAAILRSQQVRRMVQAKAEEGQAIYQGIVAKRTGRLARSARIETFIGGAKSDRWCARLIVDAPYAASHEFGTEKGPAAHDLNQVLNRLGG